MLAFGYRRRTICDRSEGHLDEVRPRADHVGDPHGAARVAAWANARRRGFASCGAAVFGTHPRPAPRTRSHPPALRPGRGFLRRLPPFAVEDARERGPHCVCRPRRRILSQAARIVCGHVAYPNRSSGSRRAGRPPALAGLTQLSMRRRSGRSSRLRGRQPPRPSRSRSPPHGPSPGRALVTTHTP